MSQANTNIANETNSLASHIGQGPGDFSQTLEATILGLNNEQQASLGLSNVSAVMSNAQAAQTASQTSSIVNGVTSIFGSLFA